MTIKSRVEAKNLYLCQFPPGSRLPAQIQLNLTFPNTKEASAFYNAVRAGLEHGALRIDFDATDTIDPHQHVSVSLDRWKNDLESDDRDQ